MIYKKQVKYQDVIFLCRCYWGINLTLLILHIAYIGVQQNLNQVDRLLKDTKLAIEIAQKSKQIDNQLGKIPIPTAGIKVITDTAGNKIAVPDVELNKLSEIIKPLESRAKRIYSSDITDIPQGFSKVEFQKFAKSVRQLAKAAGLPEGELVIQGSRVKGTARISGRNVSDVDIALRVDEKTFFEFAQARLDSVRKGSVFIKLC